MFSAELKEWAQHRAKVSGSKSEGRMLTKVMSWRIFMNQQSNINKPVLLSSVVSAHFLSHNYSRYLVWLKHLGELATVHLTAMLRQELSGGQTICWGGLLLLAENSRVALDRYFLCSSCCKMIEPERICQLRIQHAHSFCTQSGSCLEWAIIYKTRQIIRKLAGAILNNDNFQKLGTRNLKNL